MDLVSERFDVSTVVSVLPLTLNEEKPGLQPPYFCIPKCDDPDKSCTTLVVARSQYPVYIDSNRPILIIPEPSDIVAAALCRDYKVAVNFYQPDVAEPGLFWTSGSFSAEQVLASVELKPRLDKARRMQRQWFTLLVAEADDSWGRHSMRQMISDLHRLAAQTLGLERPWDIEKEVSEVERPVPCKFCRAMIHKEAMICQYCRGIVDMAKYKKDYVSADAVKA